MKQLPHAAWPLHLPTCLPAPLCAACPQPAPVRSFLITCCAIPPSSPTLQAEFIRPYGDLRRPLEQLKVGWAGDVTCLWHSTLVAPCGCPATWDTQHA